MQFFLIDRLIEYVPWQSAVGLKNVSASEDFCVPGPNGDTVMPGLLVLEALLQAGAWLIVISSQLRRRPGILTLGSVEFLEDVRPGDQLRLEVQIENHTEEAAILSGCVKVDGRVVLRGHDALCSLLDATDLENTEHTRHRIALLTRKD